MFCTTTAGEDGDDDDYYDLDNDGDAIDVDKEENFPVGGSIHVKLWLLHIGAFLFFFSFYRWFLFRTLQHFIFLCSARFDICPT